MIFTRDEVAMIRQGKISAKLVPTRSRLRPDRVTPLRRRYTQHDADGNVIDTVSENVADVTPEGDRKPVVLTILMVDELPLSDLKQADAVACGYRTLTGLKDAWHAQHGPVDVIKIVRFTVGDVRDRDRHLNWTGGAGGDYTSNPMRAIDRDAPALTDEQLAPITKLAKERHSARARDPMQKNRNEIVKQLDEMEDVLRQHPNRDVSRTIRALRHQLASLDRKLKAA